MKAPALPELTVLGEKVRDENRRRKCRGLGASGRAVTRTGEPGKAFQSRSHVQKSVTVPVPGTSHTAVNQTGWGNIYFYGASFLLGSKWKERQQIKHK